MVPDHTVLGEPVWLAEKGSTLQRKIAPARASAGYASARRVVVLCDASKFGRVSLHRIGLLEQVDTIITDAGISPEYRDGLARLGIELIVAE